MLVPIILFEDALLTMGKFYTSREQAETRLS